MPNQSDAPERCTQIMPGHTDLQKIMPENNDLGRSERRNEITPDHANHDQS
jgi:hypothetical protein